VYTAVVSNEVTDSDSLLIEHHLPQTFGYNDHITLHCTVKRDNTTVLDSSITMVHDGTGKLKTGFRPVPSGRYSYTIILYKKDEKYTYTDSAFIGTDNREYSVTGQNEYIFSDIARPLLLNDTVSLQRILYESNNSSIPVRQPVTFSRNWFLLLLILATYGIELFLRRQWKLD
ncbi:MAG TPA: hypothetical protein VHO70_04370, partial [Chitinispirillaceae bacterium]|nr:hypothetical protein [Chitinispirillaceae bacterium]